MYYSNNLSPHLTFPENTQLNGACMTVVQTSQKFNVVMAESRDKTVSRSYLKLHLSLCTWLGLSWPQFTHPVVNVLFILRAFCINGVYTVLIIGCYTHMKIVNKFDLLNSSINVLQLLIYCQGIMHVVYCGIKSKARHRLIAQIRNTFRYASNTGHFTMEEPEMKNKRVVITWMTILILCSTGFFGAAIVREEDSVPVWAPVNLKISPYYEINMILQFAGQFWIGSLSGCFGIFYFSVVALVKAQFDMLLCSLEHVGPLAVLKTKMRVQDGHEKTPIQTTSKGYTSDAGNNGTKISDKCQCCTEEFKRFFKAFEKRRCEKVLSLFEERVYEEELEAALQDCIVHHQSILRLKDALQSYFGTVLLLRFFLVTLIICFVIYSLSKLTVSADFSPTDMRFLSLLEYYVACCGDLFISSYIPDSLLRTSALIPSVAFETLPWHGGSVTEKFFSSMKIFQLGTRKPMSVRTIFYVVSLDIVGNVLRASFSFYTMLRKVQNN
ncbi:uncharacterized protein LOC124302879 [Neodiprion virginianus]|uniref:uncharacterized protein LOC124302879 n=1 Tax=Neodiprion virginianus TaxID=2961670 RepID=UPI001EE71ACD|nr:uncharacterized protein LOC124302879 [Neodiprion virginianus]